eukprot:COSAG04_NODE_90_length_26856_cov_18.273723_7_plen_83_part_00
MFECVLSLFFEQYYSNTKDLGGLRVVLPHPASPRSAQRRGARAFSARVSQAAQDRPGPVAHSSGGSPSSSASAAGSVGAMAW